VNSKVKRLSIAAILSGTGFATTIIWYKSTDSTIVTTGEAPLAQVGSVFDEVLRRPPDRLLWHSLNTGDPLYNGETIRTSTLGEVRIQFEDGRYIDIEPDSLIQLSKAQGEISLDLMEGGLFVNAKADGAAAPGQSGLVLNSAQGKVDLSGASASLSKSEGQKLNLQVVEGSATIQSKDGQTKELTSGKSGTLGKGGISFDSNLLKIISPAPNKAVFVDPSKQPDVNFKWTGFPKEWRISAQVGESRRHLKDAGTAEIGKETLTSTINLGKHYWKLIARDPDTNEVKGESPVYRLEVLARSTPALLLPAPNAVVEVENFPTAVQFLWQKSSEDNSQLVLEVAKDAQLKKKVLTQRVDKEEKYNLGNLSEGTYFWRISSFYPDVKEPWVGPMQQFKVVKKADTKPIPVSVNWDKVPPQQFYIEDPSMKLSWTAGTQTNLVSKWKISWKEENDVSALAQSVETSEHALTAKVLKPGRYLASVEAYDKQGRLMGKSDQLAVKLESKPLLPAPQLLPLEGQLTAQPNGKSELNWNEIQGAKEYEIKVTSQDGKEIINRRFKDNRTTLVQLMPGEYTVSMLTIDEHGRASAKANLRSIIVPNKSNLRAPAMKKVKVN
jgi:hypothetical protein